MVIIMSMSAIMNAVVILNPITVTYWCAAMLPLLLPLSLQLGLRHDFYIVRLHKHGARKE